MEVIDQLKPTTPTSAETVKPLSKPQALLEAILNDDTREVSILDALHRCKDAIDHHTPIADGDLATLVAVVAAGGDRYDLDSLGLGEQKKEVTNFTDVNPKPFQGGDMNQG